MLLYFLIKNTHASEGESFAAITGAGGVGETFSSATERLMSSSQHAGGRKVQNGCAWELVGRVMGLLENNPPCDPERTRKTLFGRIGNCCLGGKTWVSPRRRKNLLNCEGSPIELRCGLFSRKHAKVF